VWIKLNRKVILASVSPRRKKILKLMGINFEVRKPQVKDEKLYISSKNLISSLESLALAKAESVSIKEPDALVLSADTVVCLNNKPLGKPENKEHAFNMLKQLSGREHIVYTSVALVCKECNFYKYATEKTKVFFKDISNNEINYYLSFNEYKDKAGAYAIQGKAMIFVEKIDGCYYNVMGLPVQKTMQLFKAYLN
jgi:septum formation protein